MTIQEKIEICSLKFDWLWYKIWLEFPEDPESGSYGTADQLIHTWKNIYADEKEKRPAIPRRIIDPRSADSYKSKKAKFISNFAKDLGVRLNSLMSSTNHGSLIWEIPKGRRNNRETGIECAIREFKEETGVMIDDYTILFDIVPVVDSYESMGVTYTNTYHMAIATDDMKLSLSLDGLQAHEIGDMRWMSMDEIKFVDQGRLFPLVGKITKAFEKKYRISAFNRHV